MATLLRTESYLASLPRGCESYDTHQQKAVLVHQLLAAWPKLRELALPSPLDLLVREPPPVSAWVPEVHGVALMLAVGDDSGFDEAAFEAFMHAMNEKLLRGPLYRVMMMMATPSLIVRYMDSRWEAFHRGMKLHADRPADQAVHVHMTYPTHLVPAYVAHGYRGVFRAALEASGAKRTQVLLSSHSVAKATFDATWS